MLESQPDYIGFVTRQMASLLNTILREDGIQLFRRQSQVVVGGADTASGNDFTLTYTAKAGSEADKGSFSYKTSQDRFLVFRSPSRLTVGFTLVGRALPAAQQAKAYDKLMTYFFDHRAIDPFVPEEFKKFPPLHEKLLAGKAELKVNDMGIANKAGFASPSGDPFYFSFDYIALYHSGNPLREEVTAKSRVVEMNNENSERSVL